MENDLDQFGFMPENEDSNELSEFGFEPENKSDIEKYVGGMSNPNTSTSQLEAAITGTGSGAAFGFADELAGAMMTPVEMGLQKAGAYDVDGVEAPRQSASDIYKQFRDAARNQEKLTQEEHPGTSIASNIAGGMLIPGGPLGKFAAKGTSTLGKMARGATAAAPIGAITGAGISEADSMEGILEDAKKSAGVAMPIGAAFPVLGGAAKGMGSLGKKIKESDLGKIFSSYKSGENLAKDVEKNLEKLANLGGEISSEFSARASQKGDEVRELLRVASQEQDPVKIDRILSEARVRLQTMADSPNPEVSKAATNLTNIIDNVTMGKETTKLVPRVSPEEQAIKKQEMLLKKYREMQRKRSKDLMEDPDELASQELAVQKAEAEALAEDIRPKQFDEPDVYTSEEGKRVLRQRESLPDEEQEMVDAIMSGERDLEGLSASEIVGRRDTLTQVVEDPNLTPIKVDVDPESGQTFLYYKDLSTGKVKSTFIPEDSSLYSKLKPTKVREGGTSEVSAEGLNELMTTFGEMTPINAPDIPRRVGREALDIKSKLGKQMPEDVQAAKKELSERLALFRQLTGRESSEVLAPAEKGDVRQKLSKLLIEASPEARDKTRLTDILEGFDDPTRWDQRVPGMKEVEPQLAARIEQEAPDIAEKIRLGLSIDSKELSTISPDLRGQIAAQFGGGSGILRSAAATAGKGSKAISDGLKNNTDSLLNLTPQGFRNVIGKVVSKGSKTAKILAGELMEASKADKRHRQAIVFAIMQNPNYRKILEESRLEEEGGNVEQ